MGYRSEVSITLLSKDYKQLIKDAEKIEDGSVKDDVFYLLKESPKITEHTQVSDRPKVMTLHYDWIKWYDDYPEIIWIMAHLPHPHIFLRVGEDINDIEQDYDVSDADSQDFWYLSDYVVLEQRICVLGET